MKNSLRKKSVTNVSAEENEHGHGLHRVLTVRDLTFFGIAAIIGAGSFSSMGQACSSGGPGVIFLFIICGVACAFTAFCYAEFASRVPSGGSAYTYAYVSFGELFAWIIGWALLMEYSIGNIYVAFSWSGYFTNLLEAVGIHLPQWTTINYLSAKQSFIEWQDYSVQFSSYLKDGNLIKGSLFESWLNSESTKELVKSGKNISSLAGEYLNTLSMKEGALAWKNSPVIGGLHVIFDLPAVIINALITILVYVGVKESRNLSNVMVLVKLIIILLVIVVGCFYVDIDNWVPFLPNGFGGVMAGASAVFFAYIGFDAVSTLAEESKNPQRDLPRGMIYSLVVCTVLYIILSLILTGMVKSGKLNVSDPLAEVFSLRGVKWMLFIVSIAAVVAMTSVLLVFQMGQPRIWMSMSRDGLLPKKFASIHPKFKTPGFSTIVTGLVVGLPLFFTNETFVLDFTSVGTLFAFVLVCGGVLTLPPVKKKIKGQFHLPYINGKWIVPGLFILGFTILFLFGWTWLKSVFIINKETAGTNIPMIIFFLVCLIMSVLSYLKNYSLVPVLGLVSCCYLLTGMALSNWIWFSVWLLLGLLVYRIYGYKKSKLASKAS